VVKNPGRGQSIIGIHGGSLIELGIMGGGGGGKKDQEREKKTLRKPKAPKAQRMD